MSVDSPAAIERSALEGKERDELATIAEAMGQKPPARAKKSDIVDLILALAGVGTDDEAVADRPEPSPDKPKRSRSRAKAADGDGAHDTAGAETKRSGVAGEGGGGRGEPAPVAGEPVPGEPAAGDGPASERDQEGGHRRERGDRGVQDRNQPKNQAQRRDEDERNKQPGRQDHGHGNQGQGGGQGQGGQRPQDEAEPGNRRRRRRGRDRDRAPAEGSEPFTGEPVPIAGLLDLRDDGYGFLRTQGFLPTKEDAYVSVKQVRQFSLRKGDRLTGACRPAGRNEKNPALLRIDTVNDVDPETARARPRFEDLTPLFPDERLRLEVEGNPGEMTARIVDLISPIGKGQRGLIVSPPKAGKTTIMKQIARSIETNHPEVHLIVLLVDERPEEVTDMRRWVKGDVAASTFDRPSDEHTQVAELTIERAKRMVEDGKDVVIILDGITRLARAYNLAAPATGRIMSGGIDTGALYPPKKFFGAARNLEEDGSLTILATALVETGSKMDDVIFEEFKGTGNMELRLDRRLAERRIYPAIDVDASSTRHEELLFPRGQLQQVWKLRRVLSGLASEGGSTAAGLELLKDRMKTFKSNDEFLAEIAKAP